MRLLCSILKESTFTPNKNANSPSILFYIFINFQDIKDGVKEARAEFREHVKHLPDGHRGSIASVTERPPYKPIHQDDTTHD